MANNIVNPSDERQRQNPKSHLVLVVLAITAVLLFSSTIMSGPFSGSGTAFNAKSISAFAQAQQNQTSNMTTTGNNTNTTIAAASTYNEMLNPRQK